MNNLTIFLLNIPSIILALGSIYLCFNDIEGWWLFLIGSVGSSIYLKDKK